MMHHIEQLLDRTLHQQKNPDTHIEHSMTFLSIALQIKAKKILELGTREGGSTYPFLVASKILGGSLTSIDIETPGYEAPEDLKPYWNFIKSDALEFLDSNTERFDLIYVDDWHSYPHVKKELEYIDKISDKSTIILLHDLMGMSSHPYYFYPKDAPDTSEWAKGGPFRAVAELDFNKWEWATIPVSHGLTILRKRI